MNERKFPPPPPRPAINHAEPSAPTEEVKEAPKEAVAPKKANLRLILLIVGAVVAFLGATVCGYFLFG